MTAPRLGVSPHFIFVIGRPVIVNLLSAEGLGNLSKDVNNSEAGFLDQEV